MAETRSTMLPLGTRAPDFSLPDVVAGQKISPGQYEDHKGLLVMFICRHCPFVKHIQRDLARLGREYSGKNLAVVAISSNDADNYPDDRPESLKQWAEDLKFPFPLCYDESQETAKAYTAACTPDFFLFDAERDLVYRGQYDDSRPGNGKPVTGGDLRMAINAVLADEVGLADQKPSIGCNIKWKPGNEPAYFRR